MCVRVEELRKVAWDPYLHTMTRARLVSTPFASLFLACVVEINQDGLLWGLEEHACL